MHGSLCQTVPVDNDVNVAKWRERESHSVLVAYLMNLHLYESTILWQTQLDALYQQFISPCRIYKILK